MLPFNSWISENTKTIHQAFLSWVVSVVPETQNQLRLSITLFQREGALSIADEQEKEGRCSEWRLSDSSSSSEESSLDQVCSENNNPNPSDINTIRLGLKESMKVLRTYQSMPSLARAIRSLDMRCKDIKRTIKILYAPQPSEQQDEQELTSTTRSTSDDTLQSVGRERRGSFLSLISRTRNEKVLSKINLTLISLGIK